MLVFGGIGCFRIFKVLFQVTMKMLCNIVDDICASTVEEVGQPEAVVATCCMVCLLAIVYSKDRKLFSRLEGAGEQCYIAVFLVFPGARNLWRR